MVAVLVLVLLLELFPDHAATIKMVWVGAGVLYVLVWAVRRYRSHHLRKSTEAAQLSADAAEYREYKTALDAIRTKYDPHRDLADPTSLSPEYLSELNSLHDRHQSMLERKFGTRSSGTLAGKTDVNA